MFLKSLVISDRTKVIRKINFHKGLNLIIDESESQITGNNVGKTTVLKLIDFCLGGGSKDIFLDQETKKQEYKIVKDFLISNEVVVTLTLSTNLESHAETLVIQRNFLNKSKAIRTIDGEQVLEKDFETNLKTILFPNLHTEKPSFRQIISHNIRYKDESINNTLKTLNKYTTDAEYEALYLFLFGIDFSKGDRKQELLAEIKQEYTFKQRLEEGQTKTAYETALALINNKIEELDRKKSNFNLNENFENDLNDLNEVRYTINVISSTIGNLKIRRDLIKEAELELTNSKASIDLRQLEIIYEQATSKVPEIQKSFSDLVSFHNSMIDEKVKFITKELPLLEKSILENEVKLKRFLAEEARISATVTKSDSFEALEGIIGELTESYRRKGEYENIVSQLDKVEAKIRGLKDQIDEIENELFNDDFELIVKGQLNKFNKHFASISDELYGEQYAVKYDIITNRNGQRLYSFSTFNANMSSGKKQGEISCFDLAYTMFADEQGIPCLHFLLNDKKELMHDNQLVKIADFVNRNNIQFVASILKDKLPLELADEQYVVVKLSQEDKLFRIENNGFEG